MGLIHRFCEKGRTEYFSAFTRIIERTLNIVFFDYFFF